MIAISFHVPTTSNQGIPWTGTKLTDFEAHLIADYGGFSRPPLTIRGGWAGDDGVVYNDECYEYVLAVNGMLESYNRIATTVEYIKRHFEQRAIFVRYLHQAEIL